MGDSQEHLSTVHKNITKTLKSLSFLLRQHENLIFLPVEVPLNIISGFFYSWGPIYTLYIHVS